MHRSHLFFLITLLFASCSQAVVFEHTEVFDNQIWNRFHFIELDVPVADADALYDLELYFTHGDDYPSDHIAVNFTVYFSSGGMRSRDYTIRLQDGSQNWTGEKTDLGFKQRFTLISHMQFPEAGTQHIRIESKMTKFDLTGVVSLGFVVTKKKD